MSRWSRKSDEEKAAAEANRKKYSRSSEELRKDLLQQCYDVVIRNHEIPIMCPRLNLWNGCISYTIEERKTLLSDKPIPLYVGICRFCKVEHTRLLIGDPLESVILAQIAYELMKEGRLVDKRVQT